jgi:hypothetical protein
VELALIPPLEMLGACGNSQYQLLLPQLWFKYEEYRNFYTKLWVHDERQFIIMDNGAAEGHVCSSADLIRAAYSANAEEVVIPDFIGDMEKSRVALEGFIDFLDRSPVYSIGSLRFMAVAQGQTLEEVMKYITKVLMNDVYRLYVDTIGLPRHLLKTLNNTQARIQIATELYDYYGASDLPAIHFLGASPLWCSELEAAAQQVPFIRGMDTSMPFVYGYAQELLSDEKQINRPRNYFELPYSEKAFQYSIKNVRTMQDWITTGIVV